MMKFAKLLLESYTHLTEGVNDGLFWLTGQQMPAPGQQVTLNHPTGGEGVTNPTIILQTDNNNITTATGGPFGDRARNINNLSAQDRTMINNWYSGKGDGEGGADASEVDQTQEPQQPTDPFELDPTLSSLGQEDKDRLLKIEEAIPGSIENLKTMYSNSLKLLVGYKKPTKIGQQALSEKVLFQKMFGGKSKGSVAYALEREIDAGAVRIDRTNSIAFALDGIPVAELSGSLESMASFSEAYSKSLECDKSNVDAFSKVSDTVRQDTSSGSFFFASPLDGNRFGISLSVAEQNPLNLMAKAYNDNLEKCAETVEDIDSYKIPEKRVEAGYTGDTGNIGNIVKEGSETVKEAAFLAHSGRKEEAAEKLRELMSKFGKTVFNALAMKRDVEGGTHAVDEMYAEVIDTLADMDIVDEKSVREFVQGPLKNYFLESLDFLNQIKPDYAARVGGTAGKGDKSDVDYVFKEERSLEGETGGVGMQEVKFEDLAPEVQTAIKKSGDEIQETYWVIPDSLKSYVREGDVKVGEATSLRTESQRLLDDDNEHGNFVWDKLLEGLPEEEREAVKAEGREVLRQMNQASEKVTALMEPFTTTSYPTPTAARKFVADQLRKVIPGTKGINKLADEIITEWEKTGAKKAIGLMDREIQNIVLNKNIVINARKNEVDKKKSRGGLAAIAALQASVGVDSTGRNPMSEIHIFSTGNTYRASQNDEIINPLRELLDPKSMRNLQLTRGQLGKQTIRVQNDGSLNFIPGKGKASATSTISTRNMKPQKKKN